MDEALTDYGQRNEASVADCEEHLAMARFSLPSPELLAIRAAVSERPEDTTQLIKARQAMIAPAAFSNPENLERLLNGAPR